MLTSLIRPWNNTYLKTSNNKMKKKKQGQGILKDLFQASKVLQKHGDGNHACLNSEQSSWPLQKNVL